MSALTVDQLELLQRARDGVPLWGGSLATARLRRDAELLFAIRLIEPGSSGLYRLTAVGLEVIETVEARRMSLAGR